MDGGFGGGNVTIPSTGSASVRTTLAVNNVALNSGVHVVRLGFDVANSAGDLGRFNSLDFVLTAANQPPAVTIVGPSQRTIFSTGDT